MAFIIFIAVFALLIVIARSELKHGTKLGQLKELNRKMDEAARDNRNR